MGMAIIQPLGALYGLQPFHAARTDELVRRKFAQILDAPLG
jgi:hypothetical protein